MTISSSIDLIEKGIPAALSALSAASSLVKKLGNSEPNSVFNELAAALLDIQLGSANLIAENTALKKKLEEKVAVVGPFIPFNYYYFAHDHEKEHPLCPYCFLENGDEVYMSPKGPGDNGRGCTLRTGHYVMEQSAMEAAHPAFFSSNRR